MTELFKRVAEEFEYSADEQELMKEVWGPTPWMIDVVTEGREDQIYRWCFRQWGHESSPIHNKNGTWHRGNVTMFGKTWMGFATEEMMLEFQKQFP